MKKSLRILSLVLAVVMIFGTMSVMGSAYSAYKGDGVTLQYDDVDIPSFSVDQYASMALDEVDRMLADAQINVDIYIYPALTVRLRVSMSFLTPYPDLSPQVFWVMRQSLLTRSTTRLPTLQEQTAISR